MSSCFAGLHACCKSVLCVSVCAQSESDSVCGSVQRIVEDNPFGKQEESKNMPIPWSYFSMNISVFMHFFFK